MSNQKKNLKEQEELALSIYVDDEDCPNLSVPVVFIHALAGNSQQWKHQLTHFRKTRRAIAVDLRGHGRSSSLPTTDFSIESMAADLYSALHNLEIKKFVLVGHSMGAFVAMAYASSYASQVAGLLLVDPPGDSRKMPSKEVDGYLMALESEAYEKIIKDYWDQILDNSLDDTYKTVIQDLQDTPKKTVVAITKELFNYNPLSALNQYKGPKLSVITSINEIPHSLHKLAPHLPSVKVNGTGHWLHLDKSKEFNQILEDFIGKL